MAELLKNDIGVLSTFRGVLRCPVCGSEMEFEEALRCERGHEFLVDEGIPILMGPESVDDEAQHTHQRSHYDQEYSSHRCYHLEHWQAAYVNRVTMMWPTSGLGGLYLDVGAGGNAYTVIEAARKGAIAVGCDISLNSMKAARRLADAQGVGERCLFVVCGSERLPFANATFAGAAAIAVLEHVPDDARAISEISRVTRPDGQVFVAVPNSLDRMPRLLRSLYARHDRQVGHLRHYPASTLIAMGSEASLKSTRVAYSAHWPKVWQLMLHIAASTFRIDDTRLWWWLERLDERRASDDKGMHLNVWFVRT
jgi:ubiquinone/menaquinone biosynthesis C-methylase UbiE